MTWMGNNAWHETTWAKDCKNKLIDAHVDIALSLQREALNLPEAIHSYYNIKAKTINDILLHLGKITPRHIKKTDKIMRPFMKEFVNYAQYFNGNTDMKKFHSYCQANDWAQVVEFVDDFVEYLG